MRFGFSTNLVFPEPEPPITSIFLLREYLGLGGRGFIIKPSDCVRIMLFSFLESMNGLISLVVPHEAFCQLYFLFYGRKTAVKSLVFMNILSFRFIDFFRLRLSRTNFSGILITRRHYIVVERGL